MPRSGHGRRLCKLMCLKASVCIHLQHTLLNICNRHAWLEQLERAAQAQLLRTPCAPSIAPGIAAFVELIVSRRQAVECSCPSKTMTGMA